MKRPVYQVLAGKLLAMENCAKSDDIDKFDGWFNRHKEAAERVVKNYLPRGSGFDSGAILDFDKSNSERLVLLTSFHHMNDSGMYDGWTDHAVIVTPSLAHGFTLRVTGKDRRGIKEYIAETFGLSLEQEVEEYSK